MFAQRDSSPRVSRSSTRSSGCRGCPCASGCRVFRVVFAVCWRGTTRWRARCSACSRGSQLGFQRHRAPARPGLFRGCQRGPSRAACSSRRMTPSLPIAARASTDPSRGGKSHGCRGASPHTLFGVVPVTCTWRILSSRAGDLGTRRRPGPGAVKALPRSADVDSEVSSSRQRLATEERP